METAAINPRTQERVRSVQQQDGPNSWQVQIPADLDDYALIIPAPNSGSYGAGWAEELHAHNLSVRTLGNGLAAVWPADHRADAWFRLRAGHARTGSHTHEQHYCGECYSWGCHQWGLIPVCRDEQHQAHAVMPIDR